jgi:predicted nucleic acid-binding protein
MTLAELERWPLEREWGLRRKLELAQHPTRYFVLPVNRGYVPNGPRFLSPPRQKGRPIQTADAWAASALHHQVALNTNNRADYSAVDGLVLLSAQAARRRSAHGWSDGSQGIAVTSVLTTTICFGRHSI